jgi:hypothetical protein
LINVEAEELRISMWINGVISSDTVGYGSTWIPGFFTGLDIPWVV